LQPNVFRLDRVGAGFEVIAVDRLDDVGTGLVEDLDSALEVVEVVEGQIGGLSWVPMAPSPTTTRFDKVSSKSVTYARSFTSVTETG